MPPSQLKRLKTSLREQGIVGPQKSKKQKKKGSQSDANNEKRLQRTAALNGIREKFNPFEFRASARGPKFDIISNRNISEVVAKAGKARPGVTKGLGEETRRKTLLIEIQRRNKVGGIVDRRFGENDPTMTPEAKMLERFTREKQRRHKNSSIFDLGNEDESGELTHMGQSLSLNKPELADDFDEETLKLSDADDHISNNGDNPRKRRRVSFSGGSGNEVTEADGRPERKKNKQEAMKEVIAKSKLYKYERQAAKDEDDNLREELDKEMGEIHALLRGRVSRTTAPEPLGIDGMNSEQGALLSEIEKIKFEREYDFRLRQLAQDKKSKPTERTKTEEEKLVEESRILWELESKRLRRMKGETENEDEDDEDEAVAHRNGQTDGNEDKDFGLGTGIKVRKPPSELGVEDEDDFIIDDGLVASGSDIEISDEDFLPYVSEDAVAAGDAEFLEGLLTKRESKRPEFLMGANIPIQQMGQSTENGVNGDLAYTFLCPQSQSELLEITKGVVLQDLPTVVRRIRALYHPKLKSENKEKLGNFAVALVDHVWYLTNQSPLPPFDVLEKIIRHIHSLAKTYPIEIANVIRKYLVEQRELRPLTPTPGDLVLLTATGTIFPTSDNFHQVVTPAMLTMTWYIGQKIPHSLFEYATGLYITTLCLQYQRLSKRYVPEIMSFLLNTMSALCPEEPSMIPGTLVYHKSKIPRLSDAHDVQIRNLNLLDTKNRVLDLREEIVLKATLIEASIMLLDVAADTWTGMPSFQEVFDPALAILRHLGEGSCYEKLPKSTQNLVSKTLLKLGRVLKYALLARRPLELHHHRPLAIKTSIPKFEESFHPGKHCDPDRDRSEASKLRAEYKRERKGAMRELRKDANFIAREALREKKEKDAAYEKKYKRLVAEIQGEEGKEAKAYAREKEWRRKGKKFGLSQ